MALCWANTIYIYMHVFHVINSSDKRNLDSFFETRSRSITSMPGRLSCEFQMSYFQERLGRGGQKFYVVKQ